MASILEYNSALDIIEIVLTGYITAADLKEITSKGIALSKEKGVLAVVIDATEMVLGASITDIFDLPDKQYVDEDLDHRIRVGLVVPKLPSEKKAAQFYEDACVNRGWRVRSFPNRDGAVEWLKRAVSSNKPDAGNG